MGKIVSVFGSKGGVGTTFLTTNIAISFSKELGKNKNIALLELNIKRGGDISLLTGFSDRANTKTLYDLLSFLPDIDPVMLKGFFSSTDNNVDVLPMPISYKESEAVLNKLPDIINLLVNSYDYIFVDIEDVFNKIYIKSIESSDLCLLVLTPDVLSVKGTKQIMFLWE